MSVIELQSDAPVQNLGDQSQTYDVFISYSQRADAALAKEIRHGLQSIGTPFWRRRSHRVYLDDATLPVTDKAWPALAKALESSGYFVLLASPEAAKSRWVQKEVAHFLKHRGPSRVLIAVTDGFLDWDGARYSDQSDAIPASLRTAFDFEPRHLDLRWLQDAATGNERSGRLRNDLAALVATVRGQPKDEIVGQDLSAHRRNLSVMAIAIAALASLAIAALVLRSVAATNERNAQSEAVAAVAAATVTDQLDQALLLAAASRDIAATGGSERGLFDSLARSHGAIRFSHNAGGPVRAVAATPALDLILAGTADGYVAFYDAELEQRGSRLHVGGGEIRDIVVDNLGTEAFVASNNGSVTVIDLTDLSIARSATIAPRPIRALVFANDDASLFAGTDDEPILRVDPDSLEVTRALGPVFAQVKTLALSSNGRHLLIGGRRNAARTEAPIVVYDLEADAVAATATDPTDGPAAGCESGCWSSVSGIAATPGNSTAVYFGTLSGAVLVWDFAGDDPPRLLGRHDDQVARIRMNDGGTRIVSTGFDHNVRFWDTASQSQVGPDRLHHGGQVWDAAFLGSEAVTVSEDGTLLRHSIDHWTAPMATEVHLGGGFINELELVTLEGREHVAVVDGTTVHFYDAGTLEATSTLVQSDTTIWSVHFDASRDVIFTGDSAGVLRSWNVATQEEHAPPRQLPIQISAIAHHPNDPILAAAGPMIESDDRPTGGAGGIVFESFDDDLDTPPLLPVPEGSLTRNLAFTPDGSQLIVSGLEIADAVRRWPSLQVVGANEQSGHTAVGVAAARDGSIAIGNNRQHIEILNDQGDSIASLSGHGGIVHALDVAPAGDRLASGGGDDLILIWDLGDRQAAFGAPLHGHTEEVWSTAFSADGMTLFSASRNEVIAWSLNPEEWADLACDIANRSLTAAEWSAATDLDSAVPQPCPAE